MNLFEYRNGSIPFMLSIPHGGTWVPDGIRERLNETGLKVKDTDWFLQRLYDFDELAEASLISSNVSRYVVDLNRSRDDVKLYPGQNTTGLVPVTDFEGQPIYKSGSGPDSEEVQSRVEEFWVPYHDHLRTELERLVEQFGAVVLLDAHSIASELPWLFPGRLTDFNFGTNHGKSCGPVVQKTVEEFGRSIEGYSSVVNERFVGGFITRSNGENSQINAVQLELSQFTYMDEASLEWAGSKVAAVQPLLRDFVRNLIAVSKTL